MIHVVHHDANFIICDKPAGVLSVPSRDRHDPRGCLGIELQHHLRQSVLPVHRLDFEVSGLIIFALNKNAHQIAQHWFEKKSISKMYTAETSLQDFSHWPAAIPTVTEKVELDLKKTFHWKTQILRGKRRSFESPHGEWAETRAQITQVTEAQVHWNLFPLTGKPHQLRLELSRRGFPIDGDHVYGSKIKLPAASGISLRAVCLDLSRVPNRLGLPEKISLNSPSRVSGPSSLKIGAVDA